MTNKGFCQPIYQPPECWDNDDRMNFMFSAFPPDRNLNPQHWDSKLIFWKNIISSYCRVQGVVYFQIQDLIQAFKRRGRSPLGLQQVIDEMLRQREVGKLEDFLLASSDSSWLSWGFNWFLKKPLSWSFQMIAGCESIMPSDSWVSSQLLEDRCQQVLAVHEETVEYESTDNVLEYYQLAHQCKSLFKDELSFDLTLQYMKRVGHINIVSTHGTKIVKFRKKSVKQQPSVNEADLGIIILKRSEMKLNEKIQTLTTNSTRLRLEALKLVKLGHRSKAMNLLRKKKMLGLSVVKVEKSLDNIHRLLHQIQQAESDRMVFDAYKAGALAFKQTVVESGLTPDAIDRVMDEVHESAELHADINEAINQGNESISSTYDGDLNELESELEDILASENLNQSTVDRTASRSKTADQEEYPSTTDLDELLNSLPKLPSNSPTSRREQKSRNRIAVCEQESNTPTVPKWKLTSRNLISTPATQTHPDTNTAVSSPTVPQNPPVDRMDMLSLSGSSSILTDDNSDGNDVIFIS